MTTAGNKTRKLNLNVDVHHLTRVEGHGNIRVRVVDGKLTEARWDVVETPRFFEVMLKGKPYAMAGILTARICGICSIGHCLASVRATENAFGLTVPPADPKFDRVFRMLGERLPGWGMESKQTQAGADAALGHLLQEFTADILIPLD